MAHQVAEAPSSPQSMAEKAASFAEDFDSFLPEEEREEDAPDEEIEDDLADDGEEVDDEADEGDEPDVPAIDPPVSLNAEEKEVFAQLPPEAQQAWAASETRRNAQVQEATTRASEAQRAAEQRAAAANAQAEAEYRQRLDEIVNVFAPQMPDPANFSDIRVYQQAKAQYDYAIAQHEQFKQQVALIGVETPEQKAARIQARDAQLMAIPEIADPATRDEVIRNAFSLANEFGYDQQELVESMDARDMKFLAQSAKWKADSEELARIRAKSSERRRDMKTGKFRAMKPGAAIPGGKAGNAEKAFERVKTAGRDRARQSEAMADFLEKGGYL